MCLQETIKDSFSHSELSSIAGIDLFCWKWLSAVGHSGGILLGAHFDVFDFACFDAGVYFASMFLHHHAIDKTWEVVGLYGSADHSLSLMSSCLNYLLKSRLRLCLFSLVGILIFSGSLGTRISRTSRGLELKVLMMSSLILL